MTDTYTFVKISFFKPTGYMHSLVVNTDDRGLAAKTAMEYYSEYARKLNHIECSSCSKDINALIIDHKTLSVIDG